MKEKSTTRIRDLEDGQKMFFSSLYSIKALFILMIGAQLVVFVLILATGDKLSDSWDELGLLSFFVQWITLACAASLYGLRRFLAKLSLMKASVIAYLLILLITGAFAGIAQLFLDALSYQWGASPETVGEFVSRSMFISAIITLVALRYFYMQQQWQGRVQLESQARIEALQARIRPHFLFNSMNIIASLISSNPKLAERAVEDLSQVFRVTLKDTGSMVSLEDEWRLCEQYLRIEGLRLDDRLKVDCDLSSVPQDTAIPMLSLQPLVENAIYHGIQPLPEGGTIRVTGQIHNNQIHLKITNPMPITGAQAKKSHQGHQIAMGNIQHRLNLLFGGADHLTTQVTSDQYCVNLQFPYVSMLARDLNQTVTT